MPKKIYFILIQLCISVVFCQNNLQWQGYFSYNNIKDIAETDTKIYAASENALFFKNLSTSDLNTLNSIDGFKPSEISSVFYSASKQAIFVGNKNGLLIVVKADGTILQRRGIVDEIPVNPNIKKINHFYENDNKIYLSCDFGISVFDLNSFEFGDTYYIGNNGNTDKIYQTTVLNGEIYAVTQLYGIKKTMLSNPSLVDFNQWQTIDNGYWMGVLNFNNTLVFLNSNNQIFKYNGVAFTPFATLNQTGIDFRTYNNFVIVTTASKVTVYNQTFQQVAAIQNTQIQNVQVTFSCATVINNIVYIGTNENGIISLPVSNTSSQEIILPNGPFLNNIFRVKKSSTTLWAVYGGYSRDYDPYRYVCCAPNQFPVSYYKQTDGWDLIPYSDLFGAKALSNITFNPNNEEELFVSSYYSGLLKITDKIPTTIFNRTNTGADGLQTIPGQIPDDIRINGPAFDKTGNLWMTNSFVSKPLKVLKSNNTWQSYDFTNIITGTNNENYGLLLIDKNNVKWLPTFQNGLIAFDEVANKSIVLQSGDNGNLPSTYVRTIAIDNRNQMWIGTSKGLRIIQNISLFQSETEIQSRPIIILENDLAQELFFEQFIIDIAVDGANRKWVSIADSGVYLVSANGQETIYHFTKDDSPLPSNTVNDIEIDQVSGEVFFATDKGMISFKGTSTSPKEDLSNVFVYPNPVRPEFSGSVKISGLTNKAIIKVTDIEGNLVHETTSSGGTIEWDTTAFGKYKVASGVYMIFISTEDGLETKVKKVMIVR